MTAVGENGCHLDDIVTQNQHDGAFQLNPCTQSI